MLCRQRKGGKSNRFSVVSRQPKLRRWISRNPFRNSTVEKVKICTLDRSRKLQEFVKWLNSKKRKKRIETKIFEMVFAFNVQPVCFLRFLCKRKSFFASRAHTHTYARTRHARHEPVRYVVRKLSRPRRWDIRSRNMRQDEKYAVVFFAMKLPYVS